VNVNNDNEKELLPSEEIGVSLINPNKSVSYGLYRELGMQGDLPWDLVNNPKMKFLNSFASASANIDYFQKRNHSVGHLQQSVMGRTREVYTQENPKLKKKLKNLLGQKSKE
jgi:hypothetical protein